MKRLFTDTQKKIIIGTSLQEVDLVVKSLVMKKKKPVADYEKATVVSLATAILQGNATFSNFHILDKDEAGACFYSFLKNNKNGDSYFGLIPEKSFSYETACDAYKAICQIRMGKLLDGKHKTANLIFEFEKYLLSLNMLDETLAISRAMNVLNSEREKAINSLEYGKTISFCLLPSLSGKLTYLETEFLRALIGSPGFDQNYVAFDYHEKNVRRIKTPAYGYSNVVRYIVKTINDKQMNLEDVAVYSCTDAYDGLIKAYFDNSDINYIFMNGENLTCEDYSGFLFSVLDFLGNHFNIESLYSLYKNPAIGYYKDGKGDNHSYACIGKIKDLRSDKDQILAQVKGWNSGKQEFLINLVNLYNDSDSVSDIYGKALDFTDKYTTSLSHRYAKDALDQKKRFFKLFDMSGTDYREKTELIKAFIKPLKTIKEPVKKDCSYVTISSSSQTFLPRKYNFFIGLSSAELTVREIESPLLSDNEIKKTIDCDNYYIKLGKNGNEERIKNLNDLISTQYEGEQYFITSVYDSVDFRPLSASAFYLGIPVKEEAIYHSSDDINSLVCERKDCYLYPQTTDNNARVNKTNLSPSAIEKLMDCPLKYIYSLIYSEVELDEYTDRWLKGGEEGNFAHALLEKYFKAVTGRTFDSVLFESCFNDVYTSTRNEHPFSNSHLQDIEANRVKDMVKRYLDRYYAKADSFVPCECELKIDDGAAVDYPHNPTFKIHGIIDRVDAYVDEIEELKARIIDYKTYSKESFDSHSKHNLLSQVVLYPILVKDYINNNISVMSGKVGKFNVKKEYDIEFVYELLKLDKSQTVDSAAICTAIDAALSNYLKLIAVPTWKNFISIYKPEMAEKTAFNGGRCEYCPFSEYCRLKMQKGDNQVWSK